MMQIKLTVTDETTGREVVSLTVPNVSAESIALPGPTPELRVSPVLALEVAYESFTGETLGAKH